MEQSKFQFEGAAAAGQEIRQGREGGREGGRDTYPCGFKSKYAIQRPGRAVNVPVGSSSRVAAQGGGGALDALEARGDESVQLHVGGGHPH